MRDSELELHANHLEDLLDEIEALIDDPDLSDRELRGRLRELLQEETDDE